VLKHINFNRKIGQRTLDDDILSNFVQNFEKIPLRDENFEFPDLLGAAYEYLIKFFADSAGKKAGEFYTPADVVRCLVEIVDPKPGMSVYDPTCGSGGMLIQTRDYVSECGGNPKDLSFAGQESIGTTWSICKMNMLLHGIPDADIRQEDTLRKPQHKAENGELKRFDRILANPPFSQNYIRKDMDYPGRFQVWLPEKGKKADLMFVQHMLAVLKADGKMAVVMPHGVLFRGGEEKEARKHFIQRGWLEAVIGLPAGLFYGTGIPACVLVFDKKDAATRKDVLFINADREYREGKAQNFLRPEDLSKIVHVHRERKTAPAYTRLVPHGEIESEEWNCNIRRYVDNAPPPEPHDVRAHLHGGVPLAEIDALSRFWNNYPGLRESVFTPRDAAYSDFSPHIIHRRELAAIVQSDPALASAHAGFHKTLAKWWQKNLPHVIALAPDGGKKGNVYELRRLLLATIATAFKGDTLLTAHQIRGAIARYFEFFKPDLKSIAFSGWGAELIPDDDILQSQFPEVLADLERKRLRIAELAALLAAADEEDYEDSDDTGILPGSEVASLKDQLKELRAERKMTFNEYKDILQAIHVTLKMNRLIPECLSASDFRPGTQGDPQWGRGALVRSSINPYGEAFESCIELWGPLEVHAQDGQRIGDHIAEIEFRLDSHKALEDEAKQLKSEIRATEKKRDDLVTAARAKINPDAAKTVILERLRRILTETYDAYLRADSRACLAALENLYAKYAVTAQAIEAKRDAEAAKLKTFLKELGYE
jgi:type I restriction enzyme M protein